MAEAGGRLIASWIGTTTRSFAALVLIALASLALAESAPAALTGKYANFANCPYKDPDASKCLHSATVGGEVTLGAIKVPITEPAILQGGYAASDASGFSKFIAATNGETLSKAPQQIPGGLFGIVAPQESSPLVRTVIALLFENDLTKASASLELSRPADEIRFSENNFGGEQGPALKLPVRIHLENPLLGASCYVGSSSSPLVWKLTSGLSNPPKPHKPIKGTVGAAEIYDEGRLIETQGSRLVDNGWKVPGASGCGGPLSRLIDPIVNTVAGLPKPPGASAAKLESAALQTGVATVRGKVE